MEYVKLSLLFKEKPPYFIGSQLRGALGYALKNIVCINPNKICENCYASGQCLYYQFYGHKNDYHKYRLDFELNKSYYDFNFYLFCDAVSSLPIIISAFHFLLTKQGLGKECKKISDFKIFVNDEECYKNNRIVLPENYTKNITINEIYENIILECIMPLRIKQKNQFVRAENLDLKTLINSIYQRQMRLLGREYKKFPYEIKGEITKRNLYFKDLMRLSNRQNTTMQIGGLMGNMEIRGLSKECYEVLKLGEIIGVGKQCVFGLGKIQIKEFNG